MSTGLDCDLLVVGAGIHGAGVAQAAAAAGHDVRVLEQTGIAAGTSSRSSRLIHGGLRYLESAQLRLVYESLRERAILLRIAPDLVRLVPFHIPVYRGMRRSAARVRAGLSLYALLGGWRGGSRFHSLPRSTWDGLDGLDTRGLDAVFRYVDARTDDAALTRAVMRSAQSLGAELLCPARFVAARATGDGIEIDCTENGRERTLRARALVNAAGPWVNRVLARIEPPLSASRIELVQGTHLLVPGRLACGIYYLESPRDARAVFAMPDDQGVLVGTTEVPYEGDPGRVAPLPAEIAYLRETLARYFPRLDGEPMEAYAGLRVLPAMPTAAFHRPRETVLHADDPARPRIVSIYGGKLTTYRAVAERVMARLQPSLPAAIRRADTARLPLAP
ncbi:N-acetylglucosamine-1-phosphate uridyltransferase [Sulfurifustis variabilis]|uniref:N-acetylglucosamine-1-phosphate uridyltransferase n=1 Tax=Sulfurifustis variabilis TaxID=1675686 RepID=A0A1B4VH02_9GAMM|nr:FAD-dependent oxidoreductase [Sulfurifustis variabilis]BAU50267.1 N-acetylglucosamine-1-phosphate uridyltransferase [Sulfurifustis variabilis]